MRLLYLAVLCVLLGSCLAKKEEEKKDVAEDKAAESSGSGEVVEETENDEASGEEKEEEKSDDDKKVEDAKPKEEDKEEKKDKKGKVAEKVDENKCDDLKHGCAAWAKSPKGFCRHSPLYMFKNCKIACGFCAKGDPIMDGDRRCFTYHEDGLCDKPEHYAWLSKHCKHSCKGKLEIALRRKMFSQKNNRVMADQQGYRQQGYNQQQGWGQQQQPQQQAWGQQQQGWGQQQGYDQYQQQQWNQQPQQWPQQQQFPGQLNRPAQQPCGQPPASPCGANQEYAQPGYPQQQGYPQNQYGSYPQQSYPNGPNHDEEENEE